jgi:ABC-type Fe3+-hydroxamate transport system substrate-binding protein
MPQATANPSLRIASLVPSLTETLFALGLGEHVVARTGYCIYPYAGVKTVPKVGGTKTVNLAKLAALRPSHVLLNRDENTLATLAAVQAFTPAPHIIASHPLAPLDNLSVFRDLGAAFACQSAAQQLCQQFQAAYDAVLDHASEPALQPAWQTKRVLYLIWQDPWMTVASNTYIAQTLALFGLHTVPNIQGEAVGATRYPMVADLAACVKNHAVDAVLLSSEPFSFNQNHCDALHLQLGIPVYLVNGEHTSWYGSRAIAAMPALAAWRNALTWRTTNVHNE